LVVNPGSTSTKVAVFEDEEKIFQNDILHSAEELSTFNDIPDQLPYRRKMITELLEASGFPMGGFDAFIGRVGGVMPCEGGVYEASGLLLEHTRTCYVAHHPANLGAALVAEFAAAKGLKGYVADPPDTDELQPVARISGLKGVERESRFHALNQKEVGRRAAKDIGKSYETARLIVAHLGGGISIGVHREGRAVDVTDLINGDGPIAPTRMGAMTARAIMNLYASGKCDKDIISLIMKNGGVLHHLGVSDMREVEKMADAGNSYAALVYDAMIYQIAKYIGAFATVLCGRVDAIALTGGLAHSARITDALTERIGFIARVLVYPGEFEMEALAHSMLRLMRGEETVKRYEPVTDGRTASA
jgi:butyrate kinase